MEFILDFLRDTAWPLTDFQLFGPPHLALTLGGGFIVCFLAWKMRRSSERKLRLVFLVCAILFWLIETYRQLFAYHIIDQGDYQWWAFPFQLSSMPIYISPLLAFLPTGKLSRSLCSFLAAFSTLSGVMALLIPTYMISDYVVLTINSFIWHLLLLFVGLLAGLSGRAGKKWSDFRGAVTWLFVFAVIAIGLNISVKQLSGGTMNMFFIGPEITPIVVFRDVARRWGWGVNAIFYFFMLSLGGFLCYAPFVVYQKRRHTAG